jgi:hypothetical protein
LFRYLPVPTIRRERKLRPPMLKGESMRDSVWMEVMLIKINRKLSAKALS